MIKYKLKFTVALLLCVVLLSFPALSINSHAATPDDPEQTQNDEPNTVIIPSVDDMPDPNADDTPDVVIVDEDTPLGDEVDKTDNATNGGNIWLIVGIAAGAAAVAAIVAAIIVKKVKAK